MTSVVRELDRCVFCDDTDMSEAHLIADWAHRAFARKRKPDTFLSGTFSGPSEFRVHTVAIGDAVATGEGNLPHLQQRVAVEERQRRIAGPSPVGTG
jgi:hypothetical protein